MIKRMVDVTQIELAATKGVHLSFCCGLVFFNRISDNWWKKQSSSNLMADVIVFFKASILLCLSKNVVFCGYG